MLLAVNANNTTTLLGLCDSEGERVVASWRVSTRRERLADEWYALLTPLLAGAGHAPSELAAMIVGSVVPSATTALAAMARLRLGIEPLVVGPDVTGGVRSVVDNPREVGPDRLANTAAAYDRYGGPAIVIDFGTATNFDVVSAEGAFIGGAIAPGLAVALDALTGRAARLYAVDLALPPRAIGTDTTTNLQAGAVLGHLAMVEGLIGRIRTELGTDATTIATGGLAPIVAGASPAIVHHDPQLTLDGLRVIFRRETGRESIGGRR